MIDRDRQNDSFPVCPKCGIKLELGDRFCWNCGTDVNDKIIYKPEYRNSRILRIILRVLIAAAILIFLFFFPVEVEMPDVERMADSVLQIKEMVRLLV